MLLLNRRSSFHSQKGCACVSVYPVKIERLLNVLMQRPSSLLTDNDETTVLAERPRDLSDVSKQMFVDRDRPLGQPPEASPER